jgi:hypothetical protein
MIFPRKPKPSGNKRGKGEGGGKEAVLSQFIYQRVLRR